MHSQQPTVGIVKRDKYSFVVSVLKWAFPVLAVVLIGSIFVISNGPSIPGNTEGPWAEIATGQEITNPNFSGVTKSGDAFTIAAKWALPDGPKPTQLELSEPRTTINFSDGRTLRTTAGKGELDINNNIATLSNGVKLRMSDGYTASTTNVELNLKTGNVLSEGPVVATGPLGSIEAGSMMLKQDLDQKAPGEAVLMFNNGVKLVYTPKEG